jgi:OmcA/MtrC family decaheme c-type cytochrome
VAITFSGPTVPDYLTGNAPVTEALPLTAAAIGNQFSYTFTAALPPGASGTWAVGIEARREAATVHYRAGTNSADSFPWPYTGETLIEYADNPVVYVDTSAGTWPGGQPVPRRQVVDRALCAKCHQSLSLHGGLRHSVDYCVMCHAPDGTDWSRRPKAASGNVNLSTVVSPTEYGTYDGIEERSIHFKMLVHRIHTGERSGTAALELGRPFAVYGFPGGAGAVNFFDEVRFPNQLQNCMLCHVGRTHTIEAMPAGAQPTTANETGTIQHQGTASHGAAEARLLPVQASCLSCHETGTAQFHDATYTVGTAEQCAQCHAGSGSLGVDAAHGIAP